MADEQAGTLAFLQNFYTDITLYMPFEAHEREAVPAVVSAPAEATTPVAAAPAPRAAAAPPVAPAVAPVVPVVAPVAPIAAPVAPIAAPTPAPKPVPPIAAAAGKLPSLAGTGLGTPPATPPAAPASPAAAPVVAPYLLTKFNTLGANAQGVVLLVRLPDERFKKLPRNVFLNNLLKAIGLVMADVVLVNVEGPYPVALQNLRKEIAATHILAFGKNLLDVAVRTTQIYEPVQFPAVGLAYLAGAEVEMIEYDTSLKKRLWGGLQRMFLS
ncbi:hypothetical protein [Hymenobacter sp. BT559]|uniref:hypothetical protein n=1 Tax=Hymenobacter sp. BT559 TaxID=2795729 RepID=UPI0018EDD9D1|nr:hypothetical protein [Hymenobacter sp. BT559]MBJ6142740.1 hypothetical protein [Hymenobacter sp. BT559]